MQRPTRQHELEVVRLALGEASRTVPEVLWLHQVSIRRPKDKRIGESANGRLCRLVDSLIR